MNIDEFWKLIETSREQVTDPFEAHEVLCEELISMGKQEIIEFSKHWYDLMNKSYKWDLWAVAYIIGGGCSDDGFTDFRYWLISQGKEVFNKVVESPKTVIEFVNENTFAGYEEIGYVMHEAFEEVTGGDELPGLDELGLSWLEDPVGNQWDEDELPNMFPELCKMFDF